MLTHSQPGRNATTCWKGCRCSCSVKSYTQSMLHQMLHSNPRSHAAQAKFGWSPSCPLPKQQQQLRSVLRVSCRTACGCSSLPAGTSCCSSAPPCTHCSAAAPARHLLQATQHDMQMKSQGIANICWLSLAGAELIYSGMQQQRWQFAYTKSCSKGGCGGIRSALNC
jgi:hypothetical protein